MNTSRFTLSSKPFSMPNSGSTKLEKSIDPWRLVHFYTFAIFFLGAFILQASRSTEISSKHLVYEEPQVDTTCSSRSSVFDETLTPLSLDLMSFSKIVKCTELHDGTYCYKRYSDDLRREIANKYDSNVSNLLNSCFQASVNMSNDIPLLLDLQSCIIEAAVILNKLPQDSIFNRSNDHVNFNSYIHNNNTGFFPSIGSLVCILLFFISLVNRWSSYSIAKCLNFFKYNIIILIQKLSKVMNDLKVKIIDHLKATESLKYQILDFLEDNYFQINQLLETIIDDHKKIIEIIKISLSESLNKEPEMEIRNEESPISDYDSNESLTESSSKSHILQVSSPVDDSEKTKPFDSGSATDIIRNLHPDIPLVNNNRIVLGEISSSISPELLKENYKYPHYNVNSQNSFSQLRRVLQNSINRDISPLVTDSVNQDKALKVAIDKRVFNLNTIEGRLQWSEYMLNKKEALKSQTTISPQINRSTSTTGANTEDSSAGIQNQKNKLLAVSNSGNKIIESIFIGSKEDDKENISIDEFHQLDLVSKAMEILNKPVNKISDSELKDIRFAIKLSEFNKISTVDRNGKQLRRILIPGVGWRSSKFFKRLHAAFNL